MQNSILFKISLFLILPIGSALTIESCCNVTTQYPDTYVWKSLNTTNVGGSRSAVTYVRYDPFGLIDRLRVSEIDTTGAVKRTPLIEKPVRDLKCPRGTTTPSRYHNDNTANADNQMLCLGQFLKPKSWYLFCQSRHGSSCDACYVDYTDESGNKKWLDLDTASSKMVGNSLKLRFRNNHPSIGYNVTAEILQPHQEILKRFTIDSARNSEHAEVVLENVAAKIRGTTLYLHIKPKAPNKCDAFGPVQIIIRKNDGTAPERRVGSGQ